MPLTNYPGGVASFGMPMLGPSIYDAPPGNVWFVCNRAGVVSGDGTSRDKPFPSVADAVAKIATTNPTLGDWIVVLSGHAENVTGQNIFSASLVNTTAVTIPAGTRIIGEGFGTQRPLLTFTAAGSTIALAANSCTVENIQIQGPQTGTTTVAALFTVTAASCMIRNCPMQMATSATALVTTAISLSSAANDFIVSDIQMVYATTGTPTSWLSTTGTAGAARVQIIRCNVMLPLSATTGGCVDTSSASVTPPALWIISDCNFLNTTTSSTVAVKLVAAQTGFLSYTNAGITNATGGATAVNPIGNMNMDQTFGGVIAKQGILITPASG